MFAKLKKKVIEENGGRGGEGGDKAGASPLPGSVRRDSGVAVAVHSPLSKEAPGGGLRAACSTERLTAVAAGPEESGGREGSVSREDLQALLAKRTDQCKKMEGNISDLAALIKDKNRSLDQLEAQNKQHEEVLTKRLTEQKAEFDAYRDRLIAGYQEDKLAMEKLILTQTELESLRKELETTSQLLSATQGREKQLEADLEQTQATVHVLEKEGERLREDNKERAELVTSLTREKSVFERRLDQLNTELTEKQSKIVELGRQLSDVDSTYRALDHSAELHRNKTAKLLEEKQEHIDMLQERVSTLEQRLHDQSLSGDDRVTALQTEREGLEKKLAETRQQLTEVKSTWSDKITQLEAQISHLNAKIVEDSEELASSQRAADSMRDSFHKQTEDLRQQLEDAEKRALENYELASSEQSRNVQQVKDLEAELGRSRLSALDLETQLRSRVTSLEVQLTELNTARQTQAQDFKLQMEHQEKQTEAAMERELKQEQLLMAAQARCAELEEEAHRQQDELGRLRELLNDHKHTTSGQDLKVQQLEQQVEELKTELTLTRSDLSTARRQFNESDQEKGELMVRNAQLSQQLTSQQQQLSQQRADAETQLVEKEGIIADLNARLSGLHSQIHELESINAVLGSKDHLESTIQSLQDQLADKNRTLKKQEQTVKDLRQTLQRELRVQALPNDEASDDNNAPSPSTARKLLPPPRQAVPPTSVPPQPVLTSLSSSAVLPVSSSSSVSSTTTAAVKPMTLTSMMQVSQERGIVVRRDLEQDINFQYLKHVVLKFMLSRESEAVQLIKAVAVLLNFSHQEQQLIRQTLEWKMSWFGTRPSMGPRPVRI